MLKLTNFLKNLTISNKELNEKEVIKIQSWWRGNYFRYKLKKEKDGMTYELLDKCIDNYNSTIIKEEMINKSLKYKKIRLSNFPSHISENIAKFSIYKKYGMLPTWDTKKGDLVLQLGSTTLKLEVKGSIDLFKGPPTFGPTEDWDIIYFVDGVNTKEKKYKVYEIKLSNKSTIWKNIKLNKTETFYEQCIQKRRPRILFNNIKNEVKDHCKLIFDGHISNLNNIN